MSPRWYAVHTNVRSEFLVSDLLRNQGYETLNLHYRDTVRHARKTCHVLRPYFPRYLFASPSPGKTAHAITRIMGVAGVVCSGDRPLEVPLEVIAELAGRGDANGLVGLSDEELGHRKRFQKGQIVQVDDGPLAGLLAAVELDTGDEVRIWLDVFKRRVNVALEPGAVSPAGRRSGA